MRIIQVSRGVGIGGLTLGVCFLKAWRKFFWRSLPMVKLSATDFFAALLALHVKSKLYVTRFEDFGDLL